MKRLLYFCSAFFIIGAMTEEQNFEEILRNGNNKFTANMFQEVVKANPDNSVVLSAFSVMTPLAQLALASVGESHDELLDSIGMPNDNVTKAVFASTNTKLRSIKGITLKTASKIYVAEGFELNPEFEVTTRNTFGSAAQKINFLERQSAADEVNAWVEDQTNHRIKDLVAPDSLGETTRALLVNAIYFKGSWETPFQTYRTADNDFHVSKDEVIQVPTMSETEDYFYSDNAELNAQILEIQYQGREASFVIVLPHEIDGIHELEEKLKDPAVLENALQKLIVTEVEVYIPKFKIETTTDLTKVLSNMKITRMFDPKQARLDNLILNPDALLYISSAIQKAFIEINEEGAEAAAANVFGVGAALSIGSYKPEPPVFRANRPFYFAVRANSLTLFNGVMHRP